MLYKELATKWHEGQLYGGKPYTFHLEYVANLVRLYSSDERLQAVAWLHDILEDTPMTLDNIVGYEIALMVWWLTNDDKDQFERFKVMPLDCKLVKACDLSANMACCVEYLAGYAKNYSKYFTGLDLYRWDRLHRSCELALACSQRPRYKLVWQYPVSLDQDGLLVPYGVI